MITLTDKAIQKIKDLSEAEELASSIRVGIKGGGCAGYTYHLDFEESVKETDEQITFDEVLVIIDPISLQYLENVILDYEDSIFGGGFKFINPNAIGQCGCGKSVSF